MGYRRAILFGLLMVGACFARPSHAQPDTTYYRLFDEQITSRVYFSKKYTSLRLRNDEEGYNLFYRPNTSNNLGIGATYRWLTINLAYGFDFLNPDQGQGDTDYLDLQARLYGRKIAIDFTGQYHQGFFLHPRGTAATPNEYYQRPDVSILATGISVQYIFNHRRFSYRASIHQSEWQRKSAGSLLVGVETYLGLVNADSTLIPAAVNREKADQNVNYMDFFEFGPNVGYTYTLVLFENFFITGSASVSIDYGKTKLVSDIENQRFSGISPNLFLRAFCGYNSDVWAVSFTYLNNGVALAASSYPNRRMVLHTGNFRVNVVRRFTPGRSLKKALRIVERMERMF